MPTLIKNPYGETQVSNASLSRDLQRRMDAGEFNAAVEPAAQEQKGFFQAVKDRVGGVKVDPLSAVSPMGMFNTKTGNGEGLITAVGSEILGRTITPDSKDKGFWRKVGEDALVLGVGIPIFAENVIQHPLKTLKGIFVDEKNDPGHGAVVQSVRDTFDPDYYKAHPLLGVVNLVGNATIVGGLAKSAIMGTVKTSALKVATTAAEEAAIKSAIKDSVFKTAVNSAVVKAAETGNIGWVSETVKTLFLKGGATEEMATKAAGAVADDVAGNLSRQSTRLKIIDPIEHPMRAAGNLLKKTTDPIATAVLGQPANTAVATLYGAETVAKNPSKFLDIEKWAGAQVEERGLANTVANRQRVMQEWVETNPQWQYLDAEGRISHFENYAKNDLVRKQIHDLTGMDIVTTKALPPQFVDSMTDTVRSLGETMKPEAILDELVDAFGNDISIHRGELEAVLAKSDTVEALTSAIEALGKPRSLVSFERFSPEVKQLADELIGSGYRIGRAPTNKAVTYASDLPKVIEGVPTDLTKRTFIGRFIDNFGLSPRGTVEGAVEYFYRENYTQTVLKELADKYGGKVKIGNVTVPFENLYTYLDKKKFTIGEARPKMSFTPYTIFDLKKADYLRMGLADNLAADLERVGKQALADVPLSQIGLGDKVVNFLRTRDKGFGSWMSNVYDKYLKTAYAGRYNINPFFAAQQYVETVSMSALLFKDPASALSIPLGKFGEWTADKLGKKVTEMTFLKKMVNPAELPLKEVKLVTDELMNNLYKEMQNFGMSEVRTLDRVARGSKVKPGLDTIEGRAALEQGITSNNFWLKAVGYSHARSMTIMQKGFAAKFGMSLEEALAFTVDEAGKKTYKNPQMVQEMKELTMSAIHYQPGILTSPLIKTMNTIWFPFRFSAKTIQVTSKWLGSLSPASRTAVMSNWIHFSNWATTPEGIEWRKKVATRSFVGRFINYTFAYESLGKTVDAVTRGQLFGGNTGLVGGVPFGFLVNIATQLGYVGEDPEQYNPATGKPFVKTVPRDIASTAALSVAIENMLISIMPSMPFYTLTGGAVKVSPSNTVRDIVRGVLGSVTSDGDNPAKGRTELERQFRKVPSDYSRFSP